MFKNKQRCFQKPSVSETGLSDFHGLVLTLVKTPNPRFI